MLAWVLRLLVVPLVVLPLIAGWDARRQLPLMRVLAVLELRHATPIDEKFWNPSVPNQILSAMTTVVT